MARFVILVFLAFFIAGCYAEPFDYDLYQSQPIVQVDVKLGARTERDLEAKLQTFAHTAGFKLRIASAHPTDSQFSVMMWRNDSMIVGTNSFGPYQFGIYSSKKNGISQAAASHLMALLTKIGGT
jgi:hypothetical protein